MGVLSQEIVNNKRINSRQTPDQIGAFLNSSVPLICHARGAIRKWIGRISLDKIWPVDDASGWTLQSGGKILPGDVSFLDHSLYQFFAGRVSIMPTRAGSEDKDGSVRVKHRCPRFVA